MARFWFIEGHVDLEYAPKKQKQTIAPKSPTKIIYVIMIYSYKRNPTKKPIHTTHTITCISPQKIKQMKKNTHHALYLSFQKGNKNRRNRAASHLRLSIPTFWSRWHCHFDLIFFHHMLVPGSFVQARKNVPCESRLHIQISNPSHQPHGYVQKKQEPKSIPHAGISQPLNPCRILAGWYHSSGKGWMCFDENSIDLHLMS